VDTIDLERTARLPVVKLDKRRFNAQPNRYGRPRVAKRRALPLTGAALERWFTPLTRSKGTGIVDEIRSSIEDFQQRRY
jgi:hypothetical protein